MAFEEDIVGEWRPVGWESGSRQSRTVYYGGRINVTPPPYSHSSAFPVPLLLLGREGARKEISPLQRQSGRGQERGRINQPQSGLW